LTPETQTYTNDTYCEVKGMRLKKTMIVLTLSILVALVFVSQAFAEMMEVPILVNLNKGTIVSLKEPSKRVSISNPEIADFNLISPKEILVNGKKVGITTLITWDTQGNPRFFEIRVNAEIGMLEEQIRAVAPNDDIKVEVAHDTIILSGTASHQETINKVVQIAQAYSIASEVTTETKYSAGLTTTETKSSGKVLNHIFLREAQQVLLEVKVAQVNKSKLKEMGLGVIFSDANIEAFIPGLDIAPALRSQDQPLFGTGQQTGFDIEKNPVQIGVAHFPSGITGVLKALTSKGYAKILAEPNLTVRSGEFGNFHVGTRFPIQTVTGAGGDATISIQYEEVGIRINFAPVVLENGVIQLKVDPAEVSNITDIIRLQNFVAPVVDARTVKTSVDLKEGESLVLAGLLTEETKKNIQKIPILGDVPILGALFRSTNDELRELELMFFITPRLVKASPAGVKPELPTDRKLTPEEEREFNWIPLPPAREETSGS